MVKTTKTSRIIENLGQRLRGGEWMTDAPLPSVMALSGEYEVSPGTVALALKSLEREGLVKVLPRQGVVAKGGQAAAKNEQKLYPTIGVYGVFNSDETQGGYIGKLADGILNAVHEVGGAVLMLPRLPDGEPLTAENCRDHGIRGVIFRGAGNLARVQRLQEEGFPVITANMPMGATPLNYYASDMGRTVREAAGRFIELGHRRIGVLSFETSTPGLIERYKPDFLQLLCDAGTLYNLNTYWRNIGPYAAPEWEARIGAALEALFALPEPPTALFCRSSMAGAALEWLAARGLDVPGDVSVIASAYDKVEQMQTSGFVLQCDAQGRHLAESLYRIIQNPFHSVQRLLPLPYVEYGTVAAPARR